MLGSGLNLGIRLAFDLDHYKKQLLSRGYVSYDSINMYIEEDAVARITERARSLVHQ